MGRFCDSVVLHLRAGKGGGGLISFERQKFHPRGGPDGGNGGRGGDIILQVNPSLISLGHLQSQEHIHAESGKVGMSANRSGQGGRHRYIEVPPGTSVHFDHFHTELTEKGEEYVIVKGGDGGRGNNHFKSARMQTPRFSQEGVPGDRATVRLEYLITADVAIVGRTNSGKSTLLSLLTRAHPEIREYPYTTIEPIMGFTAGLRPIPLVELPAIDKMGKGKKNAERFLKHLEKVSLIIMTFCGENLEEDLFVIEEVLLPWQKKKSIGVVIAESSSLLPESMKNMYRISGEQKAGIANLIQRLQVEFPLLKQRTW